MVFGKILDYQNKWMNQLLEENNISSEGIMDENVHRYSIFQGVVPVSMGALVQEGDQAMLRSVCNKGDVKNKGLGKLLVWHILAEAQWKNLKTIFLLTDTVPKFFKKLGFQEIERSALPEVFNHNILVQNVCSETSIVMKIDVDNWSAEYRDVSVMDRLSDDKR